MTHKGIICPGKKQAQTNNDSTRTRPRLDLGASTLCPPTTTRSGSSQLELWSVDRMEVPFVLYPACRHEHAPRYHGAPGEGMCRRRRPRRPTRNSIFHILLFLSISTQISRSVLRSKPDDSRRFQTFPENV